MRSIKKKYLNRYLFAEKKIARYEKLTTLSKKEENNYNKAIVDSKNLRTEIENKINTLDDDILCELLFQKYIFGRTLEEISLILNYSKRHTERLHIKALEKIEI